MHMKKFILLVLLCMPAKEVICWGFYMHQQINYHAVFLLPPEMMRFYKPHIGYLSEHAVDPDKRRYMVAAEAPRHFIDIDRYGAYPYPGLSHNWDSAIARFGKDSLQAYGIVPWWIQVMLGRLTRAFQQRDETAILKLSADLGHYIADAHVPLHASSNHNGQKTGQLGIHAFWESRIPELLAASDWDFFIGRAVFIADPGKFIWQRVLESGAAADTVLRCEKALSQKTAADQQFSFEARNGRVIRQYASAYTAAYDRSMDHMVERRMRASIFAVASFWYTAWVNAGQPSFLDLHHREPTPAELAIDEQLNLAWKNGKVKGRNCDE